VIFELTDCIYEELISRVYKV